MVAATAWALSSREAYGRAVFAQGWRRLSERDGDGDQHFRTFWYDDWYSRIDDRVGLCLNDDKRMFAARHDGQPVWRNVVAGVDARQMADGRTYCLGSGIGLFCAVRRRSLCSLCSSPFVLLWI